MIDACILCGGIGTRLKELGVSTPKSLLLINNIPFIEIILNNLKSQNINNIILCTGHLGSQFYEKYNKLSNQGIVISQEYSQLGTAGAIRHAIELINSKYVLILNGDSVSDLRLIDVIDFHEKQNSEFTMLISKSNLGNDVGGIEMDADFRIIQFKEKDKTNSTNYINNGIYVVNKYLLLDLYNYSYPISFELDVFPNWIIKYRCFGFIANGSLYDIGTPDRYELFKLKNINI